MNRAVVIVQDQEQDIQALLDLEDLLLIRVQQVKQEQQVLQDLQDSLRTQGQQEQQEQQALRASEDLSVLIYLREELLIHSMK
jgi:hypothetical protein